MAARVTTSDVKEIIDTDLTDLSMFITPANLLINEKLSGEGLSDVLLTEIEKWLTAHLLTCKERQQTKERMGETETSYNWNTKIGLDSSTYGQTVKILDTTGILASEISAKKIVFDIAIDLPTDTDY